MKFWMGVSIYLLGVISGMFFWEKVDFKTIYKGQIKMKQRGKGNQQNPQVTVKTSHQAKREKKKKTRIIKQNKRKAKKAARKLKKNS